LHLTLLPLSYYMKEQIKQAIEESIEENKELFLLFKGQAVILINTVGVDYVLVSFHDGDEKVIPIAQIDGII